ncbi:hypothetical protein VZT92_001979 [Zoarces viviparus]|uniref:Uncharacterized protein n=1 Tax=Zoarces viviparus TaxID=48416 RepID=A0AAW1G485_ZOAVI
MVQRSRNLVSAFQKSRISAGSGPYVVGGDQLNPDVGQCIPSRELWFANSLRSGIGLVKKIEWRRLDEMPDKPNIRHGVAAMVGKLYVFGGCYHYCKDDMMKSVYT